MLRTSITTLLKAQAEPTFWESLSPDEKNNSKDVLQPRTCCGKTAWSVKGKLRDFWNSEVHRIINNLCTQNYHRIYRKGGQHAWHTFHLYLLAQQQDCDAWPTIVIRTKDKVVARRTRKLLMKHKIYEDLNTGFEIESDIRETLPLTGHMLPQDPASRSLGSLCGARVLVGPLPTVSGTEWRHATITFTSILWGKRYALLPAHVFFNCQTLEMVDEERETSSEDSDSDSDSNSRAGSSSDVSCEGSPSASKASSKGIDIQQSGVDFIACAVYLDASSKEEDGGGQDAVTMVETPPEALRIGSLRPQRPHSIAESEEGHLASAQLDWALIEIENDRFESKNLVVDQSGLTLKPWFSTSDDGKWADPVVVVAGMSGVQSALLSATACSITPPWSTVPQRAWELQLALAPGDSGALVLRKDGFFLGMAIAASPTAFTTYVFPSRDVLGSIASRWHMNLWRLEEILPMAEHIDFGSHSKSAKQRVDNNYTSEALTGTEKMSYPPIYHTPHASSPDSVRSTQTHDHDDPMYGQSGSQWSQPLYGYPRYQSTENAHQLAFGAHHEQAQQHEMNSQPMLQHLSTTPQIDNSQAASNYSGMSSSLGFSEASSQYLQHPESPQAQPGMIEQSRQPPPPEAPHMLDTPLGLVPPTNPLVVRQDGNGVQWIAFEYSRDHVRIEYTIRCDVESVDTHSISQEFKSENCVYPRACAPKEQYKGNRLAYETDCNQIGWALAELNPCLRGKRGLIQRAVDSWRNSNQDPRLRTRRVRRQAKMNRRSKLASTIGDTPGLAVPTWPPPVSAMTAPTQRPPGILFSAPPVPDDQRVEDEDRIVEGPTTSFVQPQIKSFLPR